MIEENNVVGFFGLTGNPPHIGHCQVIEQTLKKCDEVWVSLVYKHPHGKNPIGYEHRLHMTKLIIQDYFSPEQLKRIRIVEADKKFYQKNKTMPYSYDVLCYLAKNNPDYDFKLVIGEDNINDGKWEKFFKHELIERDFGLIISNDSGVHSTEIRQVMSTASFENLETYCLKGVAQYLIEHKFY